MRGQRPVLRELNHWFLSRNEGPVGHKVDLSATLPGSELWSWRLAALLHTCLWELRWLALSVWAEMPRWYLTWWTPTHATFQLSFSMYLSPTHLLTSPFHPKGTSLPLSSVDKLVHYQMKPALQVHMAFLVSQEALVLALCAQRLWHSSCSSPCRLLFA